LRYKDFFGEFEYDEPERIFHGRVVNIQDVVTFEGRSVAELETALSDSVEDSLEFCREIGKTPGKPYSGTFNIRISPATHRLAAAAAKVPYRARS
jgi:predicted HicB family RNase H-like nuclease